MLMLLMMALSAHGQSAPGWKAIEQRGVLRIGTPGDYAPYALHETDSDSYLGADIELARNLSLELGLRAEFVPTTWKTLLSDLAAGQFDIAVGGISITAERARVAIFSKPYLQDYKTPVTRCREEQRFDSLREINQPTVHVVVNAGGTNERFAHNRFPLAQLVVVPNNREVFDSVSDGRADVMVTDAVEARLQQKLGKGLCVATNAPHWLPAKKALLLSPDLQLRDQVDHALRAIHGRQMFGAVLNRWMEHAWRQGAISDPRERLIRLIDLRLQVVAEVARSKWNSGAAIEDLPREIALLQALQGQALGLGVAPDRVAVFFGAQITAAKQLQSTLFERWRLQHRGKFAGVADLPGVLRPRLDILTTKMLAELAVLEQSIHPGMAAGVLSMQSVSPLAATTAMTPLSPVLQ
jgi:chorismate mutase-like protein